MTTLYLGVLCITSSQLLFAGEKKKKSDTLEKLLQVALYPRHLPVLISPITVQLNICIYAALKCNKLQLEQCTASLYKEFTKDSNNFVKDLKATFKGIKTQI